MDFYKAARFVLGLGVLTWVPLLIHSLRIGGRVPNPWLLQACTIPAAFTLIIGLDPLWARLLAAPWLLYCIFLLFLEARENWRAKTMENFSRLIATGFLLVGATWLLSIHFEQSFLGFDEPWKTLTAIHFHYANFIFPAIAGTLLGRLPAPMRPHRGKFFTLIIFFAISVALVAIGIDGRRNVELAGVTLLATSAIGLLFCYSLLAQQLFRSPGARNFFWVGSACGLMGLFFSLAYVWRWWEGLGIEKMLFSHGMINAFLFIPSLSLAMYLESRRRTA